MARCAPFVGEPVPPLIPCVVAIFVVNGPAVRVPAIVELTRPARDLASGIEVDPTRQPLDETGCAASHLQRIDDSRLNPFHAPNDAKREHAAGTPYLPLCARSGSGSMRGWLAEFIGFSGELRQDE
jgi:hypothetical protein